MDRIGTVVELWRYPVKSMGGERLRKGGFDAAGLEGDRRFALQSTAAPAGKPLLSSRERTAMLRYAPRYGEGDPVPQVTAPDGRTFPLTSPALYASIREELEPVRAAVGPNDARLSLRCSPERPLTDVRPVALLSTATLRALSEESGRAVDPQRFRSNLILALDGDEPFAEDKFAGRMLCFADAAGPLLRVHERIPRCRIVSLHPETTEADPEILRHLARAHEGRVGMYASVERTGAFRVGDAVLLG